jgi:hypothetical protein
MINAAYVQRSSKRHILLLYELFTGSKHEANTSVSLSRLPSVGARTYLIEITAPWLGI